MGKNIHNWMDDWFTSLSENPANLEKVIKTFEWGRVAVMASLTVVLAVFIATTLMATQQLINYDLLFAGIVLMLLLNMYTDVFVKILKLQRQKPKGDK